MSTSLYKIYEEITILNKSLKIFPYLLIHKIKKTRGSFETFKIDTVYHTSAYKHVPLVEENICEGVKNNVFSTLAILKQL